MVYAGEDILNSNMQTLPGGISSLGYVLLVFHLGFRYNGGMNFLCVVNTEGELWQADFSVAAVAAIWWD